MPPRFVAPLLQTAKELTDIIKERVKALGYDRYKLVVNVTVGQKKGQAMRFASRCLWDTSCDNLATEFYENKTLYCVAQVRTRMWRGGGGFVNSRAAGMSRCSGLGSFSSPAPPPPLPPPSRRCTACTTNERAGGFSLRLPAFLFHHACMNTKKCMISCAGLPPPICRHRTCLRTEDRRREPIHG